MCYEFFFFFKQKTAYEMRISDWSSDVCSSDLSLYMVKPRSALPFPRRRRPQSQDIERCSPASYGQAEVERPASSLSCDRSVMPLYVSLCECHTWPDQGQCLAPSL